MAIVERHVQYNVKSEAAYKKWEKGWAEVESRLGGFPPKRHPSVISGADYIGTMIWERVWESMAAMEAASVRLFEDPEGQRLVSSYESILDGERVEFYYVEKIL